MEVLKSLKIIVWVVTISMFCYQLNTATINLMYPPRVDSTYERDITDDDIPLITVCRTNQTNFTRLEELEFYSYESFLSGDTYCNFTKQCHSWGAHVNLTFDEIKSQVFDLDEYNSIRISGGSYKDNLVFIPSYGLCKETLHINVTQKLHLTIRGRKLDEARVLITDRNYRSYILPDLSSHVGSRISMKRGTKYFIDVNIQERDFCEDEETPKIGEKFKKCVDDKVQEDFMQNKVECVPPWLSYNNQCNLTYSENFYGEFKNIFKENYLEMAEILSNNKFEEACRTSCKKKTFIVNEKGTKKNHFLSEVVLTFNPKVLVTERVPNYDMFKYIIDVGSSLGLWLGLSVLGLHDLVVLAVKFIKDYFIIKRIRSAVFK